MDVQLHGRQLPRRQPAPPAQRDLLVRVGVEAVESVDRSERGLTWRRALPLLTPAFDLVAVLCALVLVRPHWPGLVYAASVPLVMAACRAYRPRIAPRASDELPGLVARLCVPVVPIGLVVGSSPLPALFRLVAVTAGLLVLSRVVSYSAMRWARARGWITEGTLIVGAGTQGQRVAHTLRDHPEFGLVPLGFLDAFDDGDLPLPVLGPVRDLDAVLTRDDIRRVVIAFGSAREPELVRVLRSCDRAGVEVHVLPRFFELGVAPAGRDVDDVWGIPLVRLHRRALRSSSWRLKRTFDVAVASVLLLLASPVMVLAATAVRLSGRGPVLFRQRRVGQGGRVFEVLKFRTLRTGDSDTSWYDDAGRHTVLGDFLRRTSIDELPQILNVLRGDMSLVGPRPERPYFVDQFALSVNSYEDRHRVPPGITGWAQVHGLRGDCSIEERARFDNRYVEHWSMWTDIVILVRTAGAVVRHVVTSDE